MKNKKAKGIGLLSGGLDSMLAVKVLQQQDLDLLGVFFSTPFFGPTKGVDYEHLLGIPVRIIDIGDKHLEMLKRPVYGYGSQMNPCIDCHALMLREAGRMMESEGAGFLFTGEVLGQRSMSQRRDSLRSVEKLSGYPGRVLRPLSARLLAPTRMEIEGSVDRSKLLDIQGRSRKRQIALAEQFGITDYPQPGGGCVLTKHGFGKKLRALFDLYAQAGVREAQAIGCGRLLRLPGSHLYVIGRNHADNEELEKLAGSREYLLRVVDYPGPRGLLFFSAEVEQELSLAAMVLASYSDAPKGREIEIAWSRAGRFGTFKQPVVDRSNFQQYLI